MRMEKQCKHRAAWLAPDCYCRGQAALATLLICAAFVHGASSIELTQKELSSQETNRIMTGRELRMIELKKEINELSREIGRLPPYDVSDSG